MATFSSATDVTDLRTIYLAYVAEITHSDATTQDLYRKQATAQINLWADKSLTSVQNINAASASSYSSGVGGSFQKKDQDKEQQMADKALAAFIRICALGGVTVPATKSNLGFWAFSGSRNVY